MHQGQSGRDIFQRASNQLEALYSESEAQALAYWLMEDLLHLSRVQIALGATLPSAQSIFEEALERVRLGEPIQYVLGYAWFRGKKFHVAPGALIPRPETELLVEVILEHTRRETLVLDIGTGSGCIALSVASECVGSRVHAWDISEKALEVARRNATLMQLPVKWKLVDVLAEWPAGMFDVIASNPPYVLESEQKEMHDNVLDHEPAGALFVPDDDPLRFYRSIATKALQHLRAGGLLAFEINERFGEAVRLLLEQLGYRNAKLLCDFHEKDRVVTGIRQ